MTFANWCILCWDGNHKNGKSQDLCVPQINQVVKLRQKNFINVPTFIERHKTLMEPRRPQGDLEKVILVYKNQYIYFSLYQLNNACCFKYPLSFWSGTYIFYMNVHVALSLSFFMSKIHKSLFTVSLL